MAKISKISLMLIIIEKTTLYCYCISDEEKYLS